MTKSPVDIDKMRIAGRLTAKVLENLEGKIIAGMSTADVDRICDQFITQELDARPASKGQYGYKFATNTSLNQVVCHGIPSKSKILKHGDILNVDVTVEKNGFFGDSSKMYVVGEAAIHAMRLIETTQACLYNAIALVKPGTTLGDIGHAIQTHAESHHYSVVREYCGHGIGTSMHQDPQVLHHGKPGKGMELKQGMTFTIEPMINQGKRFVRQLTDGWTVVTKDRRLSAQWEHTILVTKSGCEVLTVRDEERKMLANFLPRVDVATALAK